MSLTALAAAPSVGPILAIGAPRRWLCQPISACEVHGSHIPRSVLPEFAAAMPGRPVRWALIDGALAHPPRTADPEDPRYRVGSIESAWVVEARVVRAVLVLDADAGRLHAALLRLRAAGRLRVAVGLSVLARIERGCDGGTPPRYYITRCTDVIALDFGAAPADREARVLRPLRPEEFPLHNPAQEATSA